MKNLEVLLDVLTFHRRGLSERKIAERLGISRQTVHKCIEHPEDIGSSSRTKAQTSKLDPYKLNVDYWLKEDPCYRATWIYDRLRVMGFEGGYDIVKRYVRKLKKELSRIAYMRFETEPGYQAQVDFAEFQVTLADGTNRKLYLFAMILGYSRKLYAELLDHCDLPSFLDCHIRAFAFFGGVPQEILYDRMKNVFIGRLAGKNKFNTTMVGFALHYRFTPCVAPPYAAWVKGKIERPYSFIREGFWRGYGFTYKERANREILDWLTMKEKRVHGTTHEVIVDRFVREQPTLSPIPVLAFDTSYRAYRKVHKDCTVQFEGNRYVVSHHHVGKKIIVRFKDMTIRIFIDNELHVTYTCPPGKGHLIQEPRFYQELREDREMNRRKFRGHSFRKGRAKATISPTKPLYEMDVEARPVSLYDQIVYEETRV